MPPMPHPRSWHLELAILFAHLFNLAPLLAFEVLQRLDLFIQAAVNVVAHL